MIMLLEQRRRRIDQVHRDRFEVGAAEIGALQNWFAAGERRGKRRRNVARAVVESGPVTVAAIIGIAELVRRLAIPADAARQRHKRFARARLGGQVDDAAAEFAGRSEEHTSALQSLMRTP